MKLDKPRCGCCKTKGNFTMRTCNGYECGRSECKRPVFTCQTCNHIWTSGDSGGEYKRYLDSIKR